MTFRLAVFACKRLLIFIVCRSAQLRDNVVQPEITRQQSSAVIHACYVVIVSRLKCCNHAQRCLRELLSPLWTNESRVLLEYVLAL